MRLLVVAGLCGLLFSVAIMGITATHAATGHACASPVPPIETATPTIPTPQQGLLVINEVLLSPASTWNCDSQSSSNYRENAWIEIYNPQNYAINLYAEHAMIDNTPDTQTYYSFPFGSTILAHGFFVVFPFTDPNFIPTFFKDTQALTFRLDIDYSVCDQVTVPVLANDLSYARTTDGGNKWELTSQPTIDSSNVLPVATAKPTTKAKATASVHKHKAKAKKQHIEKVSTAESRSGGSNNAGTPRSGISAAQPTWQQMHLPTANKPVSSTDQTSIVPQNVVSPDLVGLSLTQKIILTLVSVVVALSLLGGSVLFLRYRSRWGGI